jgi:superfamily II DNA or RNA helicase
MSESAALNQWKLTPQPRRWQVEALERWQREQKGVASVVTGGGKTIFAFLCMQEFRKKYSDGRVFIVVPTITLLDQWYVSLQEDFGVPPEDIACFSSQEKAKKPRKANLLVINSARDLVSKSTVDGCNFLIVDECHRAGSPENAKALRGGFEAALGLSATPKREYDQGFEDYVVPVLGSVIFEYDYTQAYADGVVAPFDLMNVKVDMLPHEQIEYDRLTRRAAVLLRKARSAKPEPGAEERLKRILQMRAAVSALAKMRLPVAAKIVEENRGARTIIFHERISSAQALYDVLQKRNHSVSLYHSRIAPEVRRDNLRLFRRGVYDVLISCRALDEGMNVPETTVAVIASSTASQRQRIQRLGRVLRPAKGKHKAIIYTLYATEQEHRRLSSEAALLEGVAQVTWSVSKRQAHG